MTNWNSTMMRQIYMKEWNLLNYGVLRLVRYEVQLSETMLNKCKNTRVEREVDGESVES